MVTNGVFCFQFLTRYIGKHLILNHAARFTSSHVNLPFVCHLSWQVIVSINRAVVMELGVCVLVKIQTANVGDTVLLRCGHADHDQKSPVDWHVERRSDNKSHQIIASGYMANGNFDGRLGINISTLVITDVQKNDIGVYTCIEDSGRGDKHIIHLSVHGKLMTRI